MLACSVTKSGVPNQSQTAAQHNAYVVRGGNGGERPIAWAEWHAFAKRWIVSIADWSYGAFVPDEFGDMNQCWQLVGEAARALRSQKAAAVQADLSVARALIRRVLARTETWSESGVSLPARARAESHLAKRYGVKPEFIGGYGLWLWPEDREARETLQTISGQAGR